MPHDDSPMNQYAKSAPTKAERQFTMLETFSKNDENAICQNCKTPGTPTNEQPCPGCGFPSDFPPPLDPLLVRGHFTIRRDGDCYTGHLKLHGFHYLIIARVAEDSHGKYFSGACFDNMEKQRCEIEFADLPSVMRDPRFNATDREMLEAIRKAFCEEMPK
jgi:hypothetical protein